MERASYAPVYAAALYPDMAELTRRHGYALAVHGSLARDMDLVAIPWTKDACDPQTVVDAIKSEFSVQQVDEPEERAHGRKVWTLAVGFGECFIDLSFMPKSDRN